MCVYVCLCCGWFLINFSTLLQKYRTLNHMNQESGNNVQRPIPPLLLGGWLLYSKWSSWSPKSEGVGGRLNSLKIHSAHNPSHMVVVAGGETATGRRGGSGLSPEYIFHFINQKPSTSSKTGGHQIHFNFIPRFSSR